ncbi:MAG: hypothetical protein GXP25_05230 [Planctomycetes bacterium]|nr:hypothetical protein [Planctomycetota bacterium]
MTNQPWTWQLHDLYDRVERETIGALAQPGTPEEWREMKPKLRQAVVDAIGDIPDLASAIMSFE